jgi:type I restriction enzyme R subunit
MAETIENNVRRIIIDEMAVNPKYYERMSELLDALIEQRRREALDYKAYLAQIVALTRQVAEPTGKNYPAPINSPARRALFDNLGVVDDLASRLHPDRAVADTGLDLAATTALTLDDAIRAVKKSDWRDNKFKEREVRNAIGGIVADAELVDTLFEIVKAQRDY